MILFRNATLDARVRRLEAELDLPGVGREQRIAIFRKKLAALQEMEKARERLARLAKRLQEMHRSSSDDLAKASAAATDASGRRIDCEIELAQLGVATRRKKGKR